MDAESQKRTEAQVEILKEILLNKVENFNWYYFDIDLNADLQEPKVLLSADSSTENQDFFEHFKKLFGHKYAYTGGVISVAEGVKAVLSVAQENPQIFVEISKRIFDLNEILNESDADEGQMGKFNNKDRERRNEIYKERINKGFRQEVSNVVVMAEGDSWFQFPRVYLEIDAVKDVIDWMIEDETFAVYSLASGGDWLSNILYTKEYIEELPKISPDVFLISGGGNDMVGNHRLATMVVNPLLEGPRKFEDSPQLQRLYDKRKDAQDLDAAKYKRGLSLISDEFFSFLNIIMIQYFLFVYNLNQSPRYKKMLILTHGYDFAIPTNERRGNWLSIQRIFNRFLNSGKWLFEALNMKGITDEADQEAVVYAMIHEFNEMLIQLASYQNFPNFYHIDCRGVAEDADWFDELHLKSDKYQLITNTFRKCIRENLRNPDASSQKVYRVNGAKKFSV
jgi:hypothetical protein